MKEIFVMSKSNVLFKQKLNNGTQLICHDRSKRLAGDRWLVQLDCEIFVKVRPAYFDQYSHVDPDKFAELKRRLGDTISFATIQKRNFIPEDEKDAILKELVGRVTGNMLSYLSNPEFPLRSFLKKADDTLQNIRFMNEMGRSGTQDDDAEEEEGPADFSACFKD